MLHHLYLGALVSGAVLLAVSLLVDDGAPMKLTSLRSVAIAIAIFGLVSVASVALVSHVSPVAVVAAATVAGASCALGTWLVGARARRT
jgi:hypothetical protein